MSEVVDLARQEGMEGKNKERGQKKRRKKEKRDGNECKQTNIGLFRGWWIAIPEAFVIVVGSHLIHKGLVRLIGE